MYIKHVIFDSMPGDGEFPVEYIYIGLINIQREFL